MSEQMDTGMRGTSVSLLTRQDSSGRVGFSELMQWVGQTGGVSCSGLGDLSDGAVISALMQRMFPLAAEANVKQCEEAAQHRNPASSWRTVGAMTSFLGLPDHLLDYIGVSACNFDAAYAVLVTFFFLHGLSVQHDFACDFAHPISPALALFLQSTKSVECLIRGGCLRHPRKTSLLGLASPLLASPTRAASVVGSPADELTQLRNVGRFLRERVARLEEEALSSHCSQPMGAAACIASSPFASSPLQRRNSSRSLSKSI